jgi:outer membrane receptor protein involved in Fe transport
MKSLKLVVLASLCICLVGGYDFAQTRTGSLKGTVTDEEGAGLPGARIELSGERLMGGLSSLITNEEGKFRFPNLMPGIYELTVSLEGFQETKRQELKVQLGGTITVDVVLKLARLAQEVTVLAKAPMVDVSESVISTNITSEVMDVLPMRRFTFFDFVGTTPGVTNSGSDLSANWQSSMGSGTGSNSYYWEGVETTSPENAGSWLWANPDQIEEIEVIISGAPAEYGNFQGMVVNLVSKSGSNKLAGSVNLYYRRDWLTGNNTPDEEFPFYYDKYNELTGTIGGPILKDNLWFFWAGQLMTDQSVGVGADPAFGSGLYYYNSTFGRVDWQINKKNKFTISTDLAFYRWEATPDAYTPYETVTSEQYDPFNTTISAYWTTILSQNTFAEFKYSGWWVSQRTESATGDVVTPARYDGYTGMLSDNSYYQGDWPQDQHSVQATVSHFADDFLQGDHEFKLGVVYNRGSAEWNWGFHSGKYYYDWDGEPYSVYLMNPEVYGGNTRRISAFLDDSWAILDRLTLNLGIRYDHTRGGYPEFDRMDENGNPTGEKVPGDMDLIRWDTWSPRLGIVYQLTGDSKTILKASYGRYYGHMLTQVMYGSAPSKSDRYWYGYNWDTGEYDNLLEYIDPIANRGFDRNLKNPYSDQFSVGVERQIFTDFSLSLTGIYKESKDSYVNNNIGAEYELVDLYDEYGDQTIQVYNQTNPGESYYLTTNPGDRTTYKALFFTFNKRLSNKWQLSGSLALSQSRQYPVGYRDKNDLINMYGVPGNYDRGYQFKISGTYALPYGLMLSAYFAHEQGTPFNRTIPLWLPGQGNVTIAAEERGSQRFPNQTYLDLRVEKEIGLWGSSRLKFLIDMWNVFNTDYHTSVASTNAESTVYLAPRNYILPRRAQLGIRFVF